MPHIRFARALVFAFAHHPKMPYIFSDFMFEPSVRYARNPAVDGAPLQQELMLFNATTRKFCLLNASATCIWQTLTEAQTAAQLTAALRKAFIVENEAVEAEVSEVLGELERLELVIREA